MTALMLPIALLGIWDTIMGFLSALMQPLYHAVSGLVVGAYYLWSPLTGADSGWTWALSIISLTVVIRTLLIPLFVKQINSARNMQLVQPKIKALQQKYGADRERLGQETMKLYKEEGVNPAASCLPLLLQMPIFLALFRVLDGASRNSSSPRGYFFKIHPELVQSLQNADVFGARLAGTFFPFQPFGATQILALVLIVGMVSLLFVQQKQLMVKNMPPEALVGPMAQQQKMMLYLFPAMYAFGGAAMPVGVLVYWFTSNLWTMAQQYWLIRNNPTPNTPAYIDWEERLRAKGLDPDKIQAERRAKSAGRRAAHGTPAALPTTDDGRPIVQRQQVQRQNGQRQQPKRQTRAVRRPGDARPVPDGATEDPGSAS